MPRGHVTSPQIALAVHRMAADGVTRAKISYYLGGDTDRWASRILKGYSSVTGYPVDFNKPGRPSTVSQADGLEMSKMAASLLKKDPTMNAMQLARNIEALDIFQAGRRAIYRYLRHFADEQESSKRKVADKIAGIPAELPLPEIPLLEDIPPELDARIQSRLGNILRNSDRHVSAMPAELPVVPVRHKSTLSIAEGKAVSQLGLQVELEMTDADDADDGIVFSGEELAQPQYFLLIPNPEPGTPLAELSPSGTQSAQKQILYPVQSGSRLENATA